MNSYETDISKHLPLSINEISWDSMALNIIGTNWALYTLSCWRVIKDEELIVGCMDDLANKIIEEIKNLKIIAIKKPAYDLYFNFEKNYQLQILSITNYEPWVLGMPDCVYTD